MNNKIIKIFGLHHSGTNALNLLLRLNFEEIVCIKEFGWKHQQIININYFKNIEKEIGAEILLVFCVRDPYDWAYKFINNSYEYQTKDIEKPIFIKTGNQAYYHSVVDLYNKTLLNYIDFIEANKEKSIFIRYEDIVNNQKSVLKKIQEKFNLTKNTANTDLVLLNKKVSNEMQITGEKVERLKDYKPHLSQKNIEFIEKNTIKEQLKYFGYFIE